MSGEEASMPVHSILSLDKPRDVHTDGPQTEKESSQSFWWPSSLQWGLWWGYPVFDPPSPFGVEALECSLKA